MVHDWLTAPEVYIVSWRWWSVQMQTTAMFFASIWKCSNSVALFVFTTSWSTNDNWVEGTNETIEAKSEQMQEVSLRFPLHRIPRLRSRSRPKARSGTQDQLIEY